MVDFYTEESHGRGFTALPPNSFEESTRSHTPAKKATERKEKAGVESALWHLLHRNQEQKDGREARSGQ